MNSLLKLFGRNVLLRMPFRISSRLVSALPDKVSTMCAPIIVSIEPTSLCNLKCPLCYRKVMKRPQGSMSFENFRTIIDKLPKTVKVIELFGAGEPLINKDFFKMVSYAERKGFRVRTSTNSMLLGDHIEDVFSSRLTELIVTLDGASKAVHESYRVGSNFETTLESIKNICEEKKKRGSKTPNIISQMLVMKKNEHELEQMKKLAKSLGVDSLVFKTVSLGAFKSATEKSKLKLDYLPSDKKFVRGTYQNKKSLCYWAWGMTILWNGDVTMCCYDYDCDYKIGNLVKQSFEEVYRSKKYKHVRKKMALQKLPICGNCGYSSEITFKAF